MKYPGIRFFFSVIVFIIGFCLFFSFNLIAQSTVEHNIDRPGYDLRSIQLSAPDYQQCLAECVRDLQCKAWTYVKPGVQSQFAICWLKYSVSDAQNGDYAISGVIKTASSLGNCDVVPNGDQGTANEFSVGLAAAHLTEGARFLTGCAANDQQWQNCVTADSHFAESSKLLSNVLDYAVGPERCLRCNLDYAIQIADSLDFFTQDLARRSGMLRTYGSTAFNLKQWRDTRLCQEQPPVNNDVSNVTRFYVINISGHGWVPHYNGSFEWSGDNDELLTVPAGKSFAAAIDNIKKLITGCCKGIWGFPGQETRPSCWDNGPNIVIVQGPFDKWADANAKVIRNTWTRITDQGPNVTQLFQMFGCPR